MSENTHMSVLIAIMLSCGVIGGLVNYWSENIPPEERHPLLKRLSAGVAAALVVPLFLNTISSTLLEASREKPLSLFILAGFCIIAAISSKAFIDSITKRVLSRVDQVEKDQVKLANQTAPLIAAQTELPPQLDEEKSGNGRLDEYLTLPVSKALDKPRGFYGLRAFGTDEDTKKVIRALGKPKYTWRYLKGLTKDTDLPEEKVKLALDSLVRNGLATEMDGLRGRLWGLTAEGRIAFASILPPKPDDSKPDTPQSSPPES
jgi:hypothetical protein